MANVTHREMRNNSGELLRRVAAGETVNVTNRGRLVATITAPAEGLEAAVRRGQVREARADLASLATIERTTSSRRSDELVRDARGQW